MPLPLPVPACLTAAFFQIRFDGKSERTDIARHTLHPVWNKAFRWDVPDDKSLQDSPLEILYALAPILFRWL